MTSNRKEETKQFKEFVFELEDESLADLEKELSEKPKKLTVYQSISKEDWKDLYGPKAVYIYSYLHPSAQDTQGSSRFIV